MVFPPISELSDIAAYDAYTGDKPVTYSMYRMSWSSEWYLWCYDDL
ncbi:MAG: hypothetical protein OER96_07370 [Gammaproteobacteria bacterium]|nr:hypothetical protein [Gammaproteobacteria bacterium]